MIHPFIPEWNLCYPVREKKIGRGEPHPYIPIRLFPVNYFVLGTLYFGGRAWVMYSPKNPKLSWMIWLISSEVLLYLAVTTSP